MTIIVTMKTAAIAELKAQLSRYLRHVRAGEEVLVTERGTPVARLVPIDPRDVKQDELAELERQGLIRRGSGKLPADFWKMPRPRDPRGLVRRAVTEERESGW
jgi:prevent-host-death family protein